MRLNFIGGIVAVLAVAALIVGYSSLFTVSQTQQALVLRLGQPRPPITEPGLHVKAPFIDSVVYIDKRILDLEAPPQEVAGSAAPQPWPPVAAARDRALLSLIPHFPEEVQLQAKKFIKERISIFQIKQSSP